jgi:hypothetical protein
MPALVTHYYFANIVAEKLPKPLAEAVAADPSAFRWGAQGPDILFFYHPLRKNAVSQLGHSMHSRQIAHTFSVLTRECAKQENPSAVAYLLGFCCHYALDRTVHPYVTYAAKYHLDRQYPKLSYDSLHHLCESEMDRIIIQQKYHEDSIHFPAHRLLANTPQVRSTAAQLLTVAAKKAYRVPLSSHQVAYAMQSMLQITRALQDPSGYRAKTIASFERLIRSEGAVSSLIRPHEPLAVDCTNQNHELWIDAATPHLHRYESFFDLLERAEKTARKLMTCSYDTVQKETRIPPELFSLNYYGLTEWK